VEALSPRLEMHRGELKLLASLKAVSIDALNALDFAKLHKKGYSLYALLLASTVETLIQTLIRNEQSNYGDIMIKISK